MATNIHIKSYIACFIFVVFCFVQCSEAVLRQQRIGDSKEGEAFFNMKKAFP